MSNDRTAANEVIEDSPRDLHTRIVDYSGKALAQEILHPAGAAMKAIMSDLERQKERDASEEGNAHQKDLWDLYAFSRINDALLASFQPQSTQQADNSVAAVTLEDYLRFFKELGLTPFERAEYHPFFHEIVSVDDQVPDDHAPEIVSICWPGLRFGNLMFSRQGVAIKVGKSIMDKAVAQSSMMYFTFRRRTRRTTDQSEGWGSNSQWATAFRRDYEEETHYWYNAGQKHLIDADNFPAQKDYDRSGLSTAELIELIRYRHLVRSNPESSDLYPYSYSVKEKK